MATVTVFTAERMQEIEDQAIIGVSLVGDHLIFERNNGETVDAGAINLNVIGNFAYLMDSETYYRHTTAGTPQVLAAGVREEITDVVMEDDDGEPSWGHWENSTGYQFAIDVAGLYDVRAVTIFDSSGGAGTGHAKLIITGSGTSGEMEYDHVASVDTRIEQQLTMLYEVGDVVQLSVTCSQGYSVNYADLAIRKFNITIDDSTVVEGGGSGEQTPWTTDIDAAGYALQDVGAIESNVDVIAATGPTQTFNTAIYSVFNVTMDENCTFTFSNPAPSGKDTTFSAILRGAFSPTWPASVLWSGGTEPSYDDASIYVFKTVDSGTTWFGMLSGGGFS